MRSTEIVFFCSVYLLFFFMIGSLAGVTAFPPPPKWVGIDLWGNSYGLHLSYWNFAALLATIITLVAVTVVGGIKIFGSGIHFDQALMVTVPIAIFVGGLLAWTMTAMLQGVPIYVSAVLTWPFIGLLIYSIISMARGGGG